MCSFACPSVLVMHDVVQSAGPLYTGTSGDVIILVDGAVVFFRFVKSFPPMDLVISTKDLAFYGAIFVLQPDMVTRNAT